MKLNPNLTYSKYIDIYCHRYSKQREYDSRANKPGLTYLSLVCSAGPSIVMCVLYQ